MLISPRYVTAVTSVKSREEFDHSASHLHIQLCIHLRMLRIPLLKPCVTAEQFAAMEDKWAAHFAGFEALLTKGSIFSTPKTTVRPVCR